jgi:hypothetical protein
MLGDVLVDLGFELLGALLVEVDDGRDVPGDVGEEEVLDLHPDLSLRVDAGAVVAVGLHLAHEGERSRVAPLPGVEQDHRDVPGVAVDVLEQG